MADGTKVDLSALDTQQLKEMLQKKAMEEGTACKFKPTRTGQSSCLETATIFYGEVGYCKKHSRTVQAVAARRAWEETQTPPPPVAPPTPSVEPEVKEEPPKETVQELPTEKPSVVLDPPPEEVKPRVVTKKIGLNRWGRYEDTETRIVFDPSTRAAYGQQDYQSGKVKSLSREQIAICRKNNWKYHIAKQEDSSSSEEELSSEESSVGSEDIKSEESTEGEESSAYEESEESSEQEDEYSDDEFEEEESEESSDNGEDEESEESSEEEDSE